MRAELAGIEPARACCRAAERAGLGSAATGRARTPAVARLAVRLDAPGPAPRPGAPAAAFFAWEAAAEHCRIAWLRGRILVHGSLSLAAAGAHLELVLDPAEAEGLAPRLAALGHPAGLRTRRGRGVLTWKGGEAIVGLLRRLGVSAAALEIEARAVTHALRGHLNRALNAETANLRRAVDAAARQVAAARLLEASGALATLVPFDATVARLRIAAPEATLAELAEELGVARARVQRALVRVEAAAEASVGDVGR